MGSQGSAPTEGQGSQKTVEKTDSIRRRQLRRTASFRKDRSTYTVIRRQEVGVTSQSEDDRVGVKPVARAVTVSRLDCASCTDTSPNDPSMVTLVEKVGSPGYQNLPNIQFPSCSPATQHKSGATRGPR